MYILQIKLLNSFENYTLYKFSIFEIEFKLLNLLFCVFCLKFTLNI